MRANRIWGFVMILLAILLCAYCYAPSDKRAESVAAFSFASEDNLFSPVPTKAPQTAFSIEVVTPESEEARGSILIYHTHSYEAYEQTETRYKETQKWRTADEEHNVMRVGEELTLLLTALGYSVTHDRGVYEPPELSSAYARSLAMLEKRTRDGENYDLYIDLHRDAYTASQAGRNTVSVGGEDAAVLMLLIGKGEGQTSEGFDVKPDWESNLALANRITALLNEQAEGLCKDVRLKSGRFNQHIAPRCVLIEVGNNKNTLAQALAALPYLADAIRGALSD